MPELVFSVPVGAVQALRGRERHLMLGLTKCSMLRHAYIVLQNLDLKIICRARNVAHLIEQLLLRPVSLSSLPSTYVILFQLFSFSRFNVLI